MPPTPRAEKEKARKYRAFTRVKGTQKQIELKTDATGTEGIRNTIKLTTAINGARTSGVTGSPWPLPPAGVETRRRVRYCYRNSA